jgi:phage shock protein A
MNGDKLREKLAALGREIERLQRQIERLESQGLVVQVRYQAAPDSDSRIRRVFAILTNPQHQNAERVDPKEESENVRPLQ